MDITIAIGDKLPSLKGKRFIPRIEKETPGFIVNRLIVASSAYVNWMVDYAEENGISYESIDADVADLGMGPCQRWDYLGLETIFNVLTYFSEALSPNFAPGKVLTEFVNKGTLGRKTGSGFCEWTEDGKPKLKGAEKAGLFDQELFFALQLNEGCRLLEEGVVSGYKMIDETMVKTMQMPGPFGAGKRNYEKWSKLLNEFADKTGWGYFRPCELMKTGGFVKMR